MGRIIRDQTIREEINTTGARDFASNSFHNLNDVKLNWWEMFSNYRTKKWKQELKNLRDETGISFEAVCAYIGIPCDSLPIFYRRLPKTKKTYIGIGMAYKVSLSTINRWLIKYCGKKKLYVKDAITDLVWIYLINSCCLDKDSNKNYFMLYDECRDSIQAIYNNITTEIPAEDVNTVDLNNAAVSVMFDEEHLELKAFVRNNLTAFKSAYAKPRAFLTLFLDNILRVKNADITEGRKWTLNTLRGYLDDSMINYLTSRNKEGPKSKKTHIALGLALGMTVEDLDIYLDLMGYSTLDATDIYEGLLINLLEKWECEHPLQRRFKRQYIYNESEISLSSNEEALAVSDMLRLRTDIKDVYDKHRSSSSDGLNLLKKFPYLND